MACRWGQGLVVGAAATLALARLTPSSSPRRRLLDAQTPDLRRPVRPNGVRRRSPPAPVHSANDPEPFNGFGAPDLVGYYRLTGELGYTLTEDDVGAGAAIKQARLEF